MIHDPFRSVKIQDRKKLVVVAFFVFSLFCFLIIQFFKIQVLEEKKWKQKARAQHQITVIEPFQRGRFFSGGNLSKIHDDPPVALVTDLPAFHLYMDSDAIAEHLKKELCEHLACYIDSFDKIYEEAQKKSRSRKIASFLSP